MNDLPDQFGAGPGSEPPAGSRNRWFRLGLPGDCRDTQLWAERFFASQAEPFDYYERRRAEHPTGLVHRQTEQEAAEREHQRLRSSSTARWQGGAPDFLLPAQTIEAQEMDGARDICVDPV